MIIKFNNKLIIIIIIIIINIIKIKVNNSSQNWKIFTKLHQQLPQAQLGQ